MKKSFSKKKGRKIEKQEDKRSKIVKSKIKSTSFWISIFGVGGGITAYKEEKVEILNTPEVNLTDFEPITNKKIFKQMKKKVAKEVKKLKKKTSLLKKLKKS